MKRTKSPTFALTLLVALLSAVGAHATLGPTLQMQLGNPSNATSDSTNRTHFLIQRTQYALDYSDTTHEPNWVAWNLTSPDVGGSGRSPDFFVDTTLPTGFYRVLTTDYSGSGYDRGHMCPSADRTTTTADNQVTFFMSNMVPQSPDNNQGVWASFETYCRTLAAAGNELLIISGPSGFAGSALASGVGIPGYTWKIVAVVPLGAGTALSRITSATRVIAIKIPNVAGVRSNPWQQYLTSAAQIETDTGYTFFTALPASVATALRAKVDGLTAAGTPGITTQPAAQTAAVGGSATFSVTATGDAPLTYQWSLDDNEIAGATTATLNLTNVQAAAAGNYTVVVTNAVGSVTSAAVALVITGLPPAIATSPTARTAAAGTNITFTVSSSGSPTLAYQWRKAGAALANGGNVSGATSATLVLTNVQAADAASYDVVVTNSVSTATSAAAALTVTPAAPTITTQPAAQSNAVGSAVTFTVGVIGTTPLTYQWRKAGAALANGGGVSGATSATLTLASIQNGDAGSYDVVVTNGVNPAATSSPATLTVGAATATSVIYWDFATESPTSGLPAGLTGGTITQGNNNGTTTLVTAVSVSSGYAGVSGTNNAGAAARIGALDRTAATGSAYFEFTLTPAAGRQLVASALSFGSRSTGTGPLAFDVYTSVDNFATRVATGALSNASDWTLQSPSLITVTGNTGTAVTFRIYAYNGAGNAGVSTANWRIDDLKLTVNTVAAATTPPAVASTTPAASATSVSATSPITITFNQAVNVTSAWFAITSATSGGIAATVTGGPQTFTLTPPGNFANGDTITVSVLAAQITDLATGVLRPAANATFSFAIATPTAPRITTQPGAQTVTAGLSATFTVAATGSAPLSYQWRKAGVPITGNSSATTVTLTLTNVQPVDAASYDVVVSNGVSPAATSTAVALTVNPAAQNTIYWDFATESPTSGLPADLTGGTVTQGGNNGTTQLITNVSVSSGYTGVSGTNNAGAAARIGALDRTAATGSAYFEFTLTAAAGRQLVVSSLSFGARSTATGPQAFGIFTSLDNFAAPIATGPLANNSAWALLTPAFPAFAGVPGTAVTFRIYGYAGAGNAATGTANWRIDDLRLGVSVVANTATPPVFARQPGSVTVVAGGTTALTVVATGTPAPTFQWRKDGVAIPGATSDTLALDNITTAQAGAYSVVVTNSATSVTSNLVALTVLRRSYAGTYFGTITAQPSTGSPSGGVFALQINDDNTGVLLGYEKIPAFLADLPAGGYFAHTRTYVSRDVVVDDSGAFSFDASSVFPTSALTGGGTPVPPPPNTTPASPLTISKVSIRGSIADSGTLAGQANGSPLAGTKSPDTGAAAAFAGFYAAGASGSSAQLLAIVSPTGQAFVVAQSSATIDAGSGTIAPAGASSIATFGGQAIALGFSATSGALTAMQPNPAGAPAIFTGFIGNSAAVSAQRLVNLSARASAGTGDQVAIVGFVISGLESKTVLVRAVGPALRGFGVATALGAPRLDLMRGAAVLATNTGWAASGGTAEIASAAGRAGAFPLPAGSADSVILTTLAPGAYTAIVSASDAKPGVGLVEVYDLSGGSVAQRLANLSARAVAGTGENTLIAGLVVSGEAPKRVLIRAAGPALAPFGLTGVLARPQLTLFAGGSVIAQNAGWGASADATAIAEAALRVGAFAFPAGSADSAIIVNLAPGAYTAQVTGVGGTTGIALVEIYELP